MKKLAVITVVAVMMAACGGGSGLDGVYVGNHDGMEFKYTFSGNKISVAIDGVATQENTFRLVADKEKGGNSGVIIIVENDQENEWKYELEGDKLTFGGMVMTKQNTMPQKTKNNSKIPNGTYSGTVAGSEATFIISGKNIKVVFEGNVVQEGAYTLEEGVINIGGAFGKAQYELDGDKLTIDGNVFTKQNATPQKADNKRSSGGGKGNITMKTAADEVYFEFYRSGTVTIDWGDGKREKIVTEYNKRTEVEHNYSGKSEHTITITGNDIVFLECDGIQMTSLDVSRCSKLTILGCSNNQLTSLVMGDHKELMSLDIANNQLSVSALNAIFESLPTNTNNKGISFKGNPGSYDCKSDILRNKKWSW